MGVWWWEVSGTGVVANGYGDSLLGNEDIVKLVMGVAPLLGYTEMP